MTAAATQALITRYFDAFNAGDSAGMMACLSDDIAHDVNQGMRRVGKPAASLVITVTSKSSHRRLAQSMAATAGPTMSSTCV